MKNNQRNGNAIEFVFQLLYQGFKFELFWKLCKLIKLVRCACPPPCGDEEDKHLACKTGTKAVPPYMGWDWKSTTLVNFIFKASNKIVIQDTQLHIESKGLEARRYTQKYSWAYVSFHETMSSGYNSRHKIATKSSNSCSATIPIHPSRRSPISNCPTTHDSGQPSKRWVYHYHVAA